MAIQIDPIVSPRIITVPETDGDSITIQSLVNQIRDWEDEQANLCFDPLLSASGKADLGNEVLVGITATLLNTKLKFEERDTPTVCTVNGGNLVAVDGNGVAMVVIEPSVNVSVSIAQSSSATISELATMLADLAFIKKIESKRWRIYNNQMIFYDNDNETPLITFDLKDEVGEPTDENVFERYPV